MSITFYNNQLKQKGELYHFISKDSYNKNTYTEPVNVNCYIRTKESKVISTNNKVDLISIIVIRTDKTNPLNINDKIVSDGIEYFIKQSKPLIDLSGNLYGYEGRCL